jgi:hypothetical protein
MSGFRRKDTVIIVRRHKNGQKFDEATVVAVGPKWITVEHTVGGHKVTDQFGAYDHCLKNFGDVAKITTLAEWVEEAVDFNDMAAKGRERVDRLVRGTALLEPDQADTWVADDKAKAIEAFNAKPDRPAWMSAFFAGYLEAADQAIADLMGYKADLYGWK